MSISIDHKKQDKTMHIGEDFSDDGSVNRDSMFKLSSSSQKQLNPSSSSQQKQGKGNEASYDFFKEDAPENDEVMGMDFIANESKRIQESDSDFSEDEQENNDNSDNGSEDLFMEPVNDNYRNGGGGEPPSSSMTYEEIQQQKAYYLSQLKRLEKKGHVSSRRLNMEHDLEEISGEVVKIRKEIEIDRGINYCRQGLMFCVSTVEMLNTKYDPFGVDLDGWSNMIMADRESYDDVFEELYEKYSSKVAMAPEIKLISMIAGSAMMFHLQKSLVSKHFAPKKQEYQGSSQQTPRREPERKMKGPSINSDDLLRKLNSDDFSDISSVVSDTESIGGGGGIETKSVNVSVAQQKKKPGRKPKKQE